MGPGARSEILTNGRRPPPRVVECPSTLVPPPATDLMPPFSRRPVPTRRKESPQPTPTRSSEILHKRLATPMFHVEQHPSEKKNAEKSGPRRIHVKHHRHCLMTYQAPTDRGLKKKFALCPSGSCGGISLAPYLPCTDRPGPERNASRPASRPAKRWIETLEPVPA